MSDHDPQCYMPTSEHPGVACFGDLAKARADERERIAQVFEARLIGAKYANQYTIFAFQDADKIARHSHE